LSFFFTNFSEKFIILRRKCRSLAGTVGSSPSWAWMSLCREWCVLSSRGLWFGLVTRPE